MSTDQKNAANLPVRRRLTLAYALSLVIAALLAIASVAGLAHPTLVYPTDELLQAFVPNDAVNLLIGLPILLGSMGLARRGRIVGLLFWPGALLYVLYTYIVYVLSVPLNVTFLLDLVLVALSACTVIGLVVSIDGEAVRNRLAGAVPERAGGGVLAGLGILFLLWAAAAIAIAAMGQAPLAAPDLALHVSDLVISPVWIVGGVLLWRRRPLGYVAGLGLLFQASMLFIGLIAALVLLPFLTAAPFPLGDVLVIAAMGMVCFVPFALFVRGAVSERTAPLTADRSRSGRE